MMRAGTAKVVILSVLLWSRDRPKSKQMEAIRNLGEEAFSFKFEGSDLLANLTQGQGRIQGNTQLRSKLKGLFYGQGGLQG